MIASRKQAIIEYYQKGWTYEMIASRLKCSEERISKTIMNHLKGTRKRPNAPNNLKNRRNMAIGSTFTWGEYVFKIVLRTRCAECYVNINHAYSWMCNDACDSENRSDKVDVMFVVERKL